MPNLEVVCKEHSWGLVHSKFLVPYRNQARAWYEANRPTFTPTGTIFWSSEAVSGDGTEANPYSTGQVGAQLTPGILCYVKGDFPNSYLAVNSNAPGAYVKIKAWPGYSATFHGKQSDGIPPAWQTTRAYGWFEDITFTPWDQGMYTMTLDYGANHNVIKNCTFTSGGIRMLGQSTNNWIEGNQMPLRGYKPITPELNDGDLIFMADGANDNVFYDNTFGYAAHAVISVGTTGPSNEPNYRNRIAFNTIDNSWAGGININGFGRNTIVECNDIANLGTDPDIVSASRAGVFVTGEDGIIRFNRIYNTYQEPIKMSAYVASGIYQHCRNNHVYNNASYSCWSCSLGMYVSGGQVSQELMMYFDGNIIENNLGWDNGPAGWDNHTYKVWLELYGSSLATWNVWTPEGVRTLNTNIVRNNLFTDPVDTTHYILYVGKGGYGNTMYTLSEFESTFTGCANNIAGTTDPLYESVNFGDSNFLDISTNSLAVDRGNIVTGVNYAGSAPDIGAFEAK